MKKEKMKKFVKITIQGLLALLLTIATLTLVPQTKVEAATGDKRTLMFGDTGVGHISNPTPFDSNIDNAWQGDYLYWGKNNMKWQILNTNATEFGASGMLILSRDLGVTQFNPNMDAVDAQKYEGSMLDTYLNTQYDTLLNAGEKTATLDSTNTDAYEYIEGSNYPMKDQAFTRKWFAPTGKMMLTTAYGFSNDAKVHDKARLINMSEGYWLASCRTSYSPYYAYAGYVSSIGGLNSTFTMNNIQTRGASMINTKSLLFVSAANGGKSGSTGSADVLAPVSASTSGDWKFTLKDTDQKITNHTVKRTARDKIEITLSKVGKGTSISAITTDDSESNITNYGRVATVASGAVNDAKVTITLPEDVINGTEKLKIFTEEYNGETASDYASALVNVRIPEVGEVTNIDVTSKDDKTSIMEDDTLQMSASVTPSDATNKEVTWSVSNTGIASITPAGLLTGTGVGDVVVTATAKDGSGAVGTKAITITKKVILITDIKISSKDAIVSVPEGKTLQLHASIAPDTATNKEVNWSIINKSRATSAASIDANGLVTGNFVGTVNVVATAKDGSGVVATIAIRVVERGSIVLPGDAIIKPAPDGKPPVQNSDGTVTVPEGGKVQYPNGNEVELPNGGVVKPDGSVTLPNGDIVKPDGSITRPDGIIIKPSPDGKFPVANPDGTVTVPEGGKVEYPTGNEVNTPNGGVVNPGGSTKLPDGIVVNPDGSVVLPDGTIIKPSPDGKFPIVNADGTVTVPNGGKVVYLNGSVIDVPNGGVMKLDGTLTLPDGTIYDKDGNKGKVATGDTTNMNIYLLGVIGSLATVIYTYRKRKVTE